MASELMLEKHNAEQRERAAVEREQAAKQLLSQERIAHKDERERLRSKLAAVRKHNSEITAELRVEKGQRGLLEKFSNDLQRK